MSRIGKLPIQIPNDVTVIVNNSEISVEGEFGKLTHQIPNQLTIKRIKDKLLLLRNSETIKALHGLQRTLINNMILGVSKQFEITLILQGVGYKAIINDNYILLNLGFSHSIKMIIPDNIQIFINKNTIITLKSSNKELLGSFAAKIRTRRPPEPYKGKGILYKNEQIIRKIGKSGK